MIRLSPVVAKKKSSEISLFILILDSFSAVRYALTIYLLNKAVDRNTKLCSSRVKLHEAALATFQGSNKGNNNFEPIFFGT